MIRSGAQSFNWAITLYCSAGGLAAGTITGGETAESTMTKTDRRTFLKRVEAASGAIVLTGNLGDAASPDWKKQMGLELYTVRDLIDKDLEGTLAKVAEIGYKEVEPTTYGALDPKQFRAALDRYGLSAPSTHAGATEGPDLEKQLEGFQI